MNSTLKVFGLLVFFFSLTFIGLIIGFNIHAQIIDDVLTKIPDQPKINSELVEIEKLQYTAKLDTDKYLYTAPVKIDNVIYTTHEYVTANGEIGYQVIMDTGTDIISTATGVEAESRTYAFKKDSYFLKYQDENKPL